MSCWRARLGWCPKGVRTSLTAAGSPTPTRAPFPNSWIRHGNLACTDNSGLEQGRGYWYVVTAVGPDNQESEPSEEVTATPRAGAATPPHILIHGNDDKLPELKPAQGFEFTPKLFGGQTPYRWELLDGDRAPTEFPESLNLRLDPSTGRVAGTPKADVAGFRFQLRVTDSKGQSDHRWYVLNPQPPAASGGQGQAATAHRTCGSGRRRLRQPFLEVVPAVSFGRENHLAHACGRPAGIQSRKPRYRPADG